MTIRELRKEKLLTQEKCAAYLNIPLRTYKRYEEKDKDIDPIKYDYIISKLQMFNFVDEEHGNITVEQIKEVCAEIFPLYQVDCCYLFGSYAKGNATEKSDVDLLVSVKLDGMKFYELIEVLREKLRKKVDLLDLSQLNNNPVLVEEILREGIKIYG